MKTETIKLLTPVIINGVPASPTDKNNGIYTVTASEARNLFARRRAVRYDDKNENKPTENDTNTNTADITELKQIADALQLKYMPNIGAVKLEDRIREFLTAQAKEKEIEVDENAPVAELYKAVFATQDAPAEGNNDNDSGEELSDEELRAIAKEAEIETAEGESGEGLNATVMDALTDYAEDLGVEIAEDDNAKNLWYKVKTQLKENN